ncbi:ParA family protein [Culicoidibacter larvae]|uniref:ParA family protein n=1 Tax=Culicoidibacter larvae TaxID=2579976 RepID=UPI0014855159|nr:AAA family ATPase [Culicoidibacter larvae]
MNKLKKVVSFANLKGGTGKTAVMYNLAGLMAERGSKILLIDLDAQGNTTANAGVDKSRLEATSANMFKNQTILGLLIIKEVRPNIDLVPSTVKITATEMQIAGETARERILSNYFDDNIDTLEEYDYVFIDTNPSMSVVNQNAYLASDCVFIVSNASSSGYEGAELFIDLWSDICKRMRIPSNINAFIVNGVEANTNVAKDFFAGINNEHSVVKDIVVKSYIPKNVAINEANEGQCLPINIYDKKAKSFEAYNNLLDELISREVL